MLFWIDNPLESSIQVAINGKTYDLPAQSGIELPLDAGRDSSTFSIESAGVFTRKKCMPS